MKIENKQFSNDSTICVKLMIQNGDATYQKSSVKIWKKLTHPGTRLSPTSIFEYLSNKKKPIFYYTLPR